MPGAGEALTREAGGRRASSVAADRRTCRSPPARRSEARRRADCPPGSPRTHRPRREFAGPRRSTPGSKPRPTRRVAAPPAHPHPHPHPVDRA
ncbi:hypothetical protein DR62_06185 [Burkholderia thailandensis]|nr:hypothetical protein DR62_06185 [Burkholderia thailandensis]AOI53184.1 hypothetical protein WI24_16115 [Burkholderia thailandensis]